MGIENEDDILEISDLLKKFTPTQKWAIFEKEVIAFFIKNVPGFPELCQLRLSFYANDIMQPSGFNDWPYMYMMDKINKDKNIIITGFPFGMKINVDKGFYIKIDDDLHYKQFNLRTLESIKKHYNDIKKLLIILQRIYCYITTGI